MSKLASFILELLRILILLAVTLTILGSVEVFLYQLIFDDFSFHWSMGLANFIIFFVLYRNRFQFKGWYKSERNKKLSSNATKILVTIALILIFFPLWLEN